MFDINKHAFLLPLSFCFYFQILKMTKWIVDFKAYQVGKHFYPVEIALLNVNMGAQNLFYIYYWYSNENWTICFQYKHHGLNWHDGNIALGKVLKAIAKCIKDKDVVLIKDEQKLKFFASHGIIHKCQIVSVDESPTIKDLVQNVEHKCARHTNLKKFWYAQQKCFAILTYVKWLEMEEEEKQTYIHNDILIVHSALIFLIVHTFCT